MGDAFPKALLGSHGVCGFVFVPLGTKITKPDPKNVPKASCSMGMPPFPCRSRIQGLIHPWVLIPSATTPLSCLSPLRVAVSPSPEPAPCTGWRCCLKNPCCPPGTPLFCADCAQLSGPRRIFLCQGNAGVSAPRFGCKTCGGSFQGQMWGTGGTQDLALRQHRGFSHEILPNLPAPTIQGFASIPNINSSPQSSLLKKIPPSLHSRTSSCTQCRSESSFERTPLCQEGGKAFQAGFTLGKRGKEGNKGCTASCDCSGSRGGGGEGAHLM